MSNVLNGFVGTDILLPVRPMSTAKSGVAPIDSLSADATDQYTEGWSLRTNDEANKRTRLSGSDDAKMLLPTGADRTDSFDQLIAQLADSGQQQLPTPAQQQDLNNMQQLPSNGFSGPAIRQSVPEFKWVPAPEHSVSMSSPSQFAARVANASRDVGIVADTPDAEAISGPKVDIQLKQKAAVSVEQLQAETKFDSPITVTANFAKSFEAPNTAVAISSSLSQRVSRSFEASLRLSTLTKMDSPAASTNSRDNFNEFGLLALAVPVENSLTERAEYNDHPRGRQSDGGDVDRDFHLQDFVGTSQSVAESGGPDSSKSVSGISAPAQQVRTAIVETLVSQPSNSLATDYVSAFEDRPVFRQSVLRKLELSLSPADLGNVSVRMNLASGDVTLEIETSNVETARILADDCAALKQELLSQGLDMSSIQVAVTGADMDAPRANFESGNSETHTSNYSAVDTSSMMSTGGGAQRKQSQSTFASERRSAADQQTTVAKTEARHGSNKVLYI